MAGNQRKVGMIGAGLIAPFHATGFQEVSELAQVTVVCDLDPGAAEEVARIPRVSHEQAKEIIGSAGGHKVYDINPEGERRG